VCTVKTQTVNEFQDFAVKNLKLKAPWLTDSLNSWVHEVTNPHTQNSFIAKYQNKILCIIRRWIIMIEELHVLYILQTVLTTCFLPRHASERNSKRLAISSNLRWLLILFHGTEFRVGFSSAEWFGTEFQVFAFIFVPRYRIPTIFLLCGVVRNGISRVSCSAE
jgi:hypothetical protein